MEKVILFGKGKYFREKESEFAKKYQIESIIDNSVKDKIFDNEMHVYAYNPSHVMELSNVPIICMSVHFVDMWRQLIDLGVPAERIIFGKEIRPINEYDEMILRDGGSFISKGEGIIYTSDIYKEGECIKNQEDYNELYRRICMKKKNFEFIQNIESSPISRVFGAERGNPIDRYYIEKFLEVNKDYVKGTVMEIATPNYTKKYGGEKVTDSIVIHVNGWGNAIKGDLETGEGLDAYRGKLDCIICTQTLQYIYNLEAAFRNIYELLKENGVALITVPGIKALSLADDRNWSEYWSFTKKSSIRLSEKFWDKQNIQIETYGNVKVSIAFLYGLCQEDLKDEDFAERDEQFPFLITMKLKK